MAAASSTKSIAKMVNQLVWVRMVPQVHYISAGRSRYRDKGAYRLQRPSVLDFYVQPTMGAACPGNLHQVSKKVTPPVILCRVLAGLTAYFNCVPAAVQVTTGQPESHFSQVVIELVIRTRLCKAASKQPQKGRRSVS